ncbi:MAG TPA: rod shape-determining protein MreD [Chlamydiales bacterium]|nr:rod shape-determining protein MreD [Chlamydiales bacterium]
MLTIAFFLAFTALVLQGVVVPRLALLAFAPFLALVIMKCHHPRALWLSLIAGACVDLVSDDPMGLHALNYTLITALLFQFRKHFLYDHPLHLSLFTGLISVLSTILQLVLLFLFDRRVPFEGKWVFADLIGMPVIDALYAFVWFAAPLSLFEKCRRMWVLFWLKRKNPSPASH